MLDRLFMVLLAHPWIASGAGHGLLALASAMTAMGLGVARVGRRVARVFSGAGVEVPDMVSSWPWWLRMLTPEATEHWMLVVLFFASGVFCLYMGRWLKKFGA